mmetsp:Transcript_3046/g.4347  ORF Transcript_3046/g.4347 Transcript_3046/m.4347 type:complete len:133 (+) Transcript_3046:461-859(+)
MDTVTTYLIQGMISKWNVWRDLTIGSVVNRSDSSIQLPACILDRPQNTHMELQFRDSWRYFLPGISRKGPFGIRRKDFTSLCIAEGVPGKSKFESLSLPQTTQDLNRVSPCRFLLIFYGTILESVQTFTINR